ncbi:MAG: FAD-binding oxidoreductase [Actinomycetota bacterium]
MEQQVTLAPGTLRGHVNSPGDADYDGARAVYNALIERRPALIARVDGVDDVIATVNLAREHRLPLAVRGGSHSVAGFGTVDDGLVIDLSAMRAVEVDPGRRVARVQGGCTWGEFNEAAHSFGLATTGGVVSTTGVGGLTLGGGMGYLARSFGLSCDNLLSAELVTATGERLTCSEEQNADLFWALRGGGGNFGVVTSFEFRMHPVTDVLAGLIVFPLEGDVLRRYGDFVGGAPEELGLLLGLILAPPLPFVDEEWHGRPVAAVIVCWNGLSKEGEEVLAPIREWAPMVGRHIERMPYPAINTIFDETLPPGLRHYWKGLFSRDLSDEAIDAHLEFGARIPCPETATIFFPLDGATQRIDPDETAFAYRDANYSVALGPSWPDAGDDEANIRWGRDYYEPLRPFGMGGGYVNFMSEDDGGRVAANYRQNLNRLTDIKKSYDPGNLFRLNQNIKPAS